MSIKAGVSTACLYPQMLEEALAELLGSGIKTTEIFVNTHSEVLPDFTGMLKGILAENGAECTAYHPFTCPMEPMMMFSGYRRRLRDMLEYHRYYFEAMNRLGSEIFILHGNLNAAAVEENQYFEVFNELSDAAAEYGITVAQENVARCQSRSLGFMKNMLDSLGSKARFVLDIKQAVRSDEDPFEIVRTLGSSIVHVHMSDNTPGEDCLVPGTGDFDIRGFLKLLDSIGYEGAVMTELYRKNFKTVDELSRSYRYVENIIKEIERERTVQ